MKRYEFLKIVAREVEFLTKAAAKLGIDHPEQAVNDVVVDMLDKKSYRQFDTKKGSIRAYVYAAVKNRGLGILRRRKFEEQLFSPLAVAESQQDRSSSLHRPDEAALAHSRSVDSLDSPWVALAHSEKPIIDQDAPDPDTVTDVRLAVGTLSDLEKQVVTLVYMGPESVESAAELLGLPITTVQEALRSAKEALRVKLADYAPGKPSESGG